MLKDYCTDLIFEQAEMYGPASISNIDILSALIEVDRTILSNMIKEFGSIQKACDNAVYYTRLLGDDKKIQKLVILGELLKRNNQLSYTSKTTISSPVDVVDMFSYMQHLDVEEFCAALLNTKNQVIKIVNISKGLLNSSLVHPREVFKEAIKQSAYSIIVAHNHPSGDPTPSREDVSVTQRLKEVGEIIGIKLRDHVIIGKGRYHSFKESDCIF